jgi:hypothetical protein
MPAHDDANVVRYFVMPAHSRSKNGVLRTPMSRASTSSDREVQRRGWHRKSGLPDFRIKNVPQVGYIRLAVTSPAMTTESVNLNSGAGAAVSHKSSSAGGSNQLVSEMPPSITKAAPVT